MKNKLMALFIGISVSLSYTASASFSNYPIPGYWTTNGVVRDIKALGNSMYIAGDFTYVGPLTGGGAAFATQTGAVNTSFPVIDGNVQAVIPDSNGGFYIGGGFSMVGYEVMENIAHILSDGTVDSNFSIAVNGIVWALALSPDGKTLYLGGDFTTVGGMTRTRLASVMLATNALTDWAPAANNSVWCLAVSPDGTTVYAGGNFTSVNSTSRSRIAALNSGDGSLLGWNPVANNNINAIRVSSDGSVIYVGGQFTIIAGVYRNYLAAINVAGTATSFDPSPNSAVNQIIISHDGTILRVSGQFTSVLGTARKHIAFLRTSDGGLTSWSPAEVNADVDNIAVSPDEQTLFVCGQFTTVSSLSRQYIASLVISDGTLTNWNPGAENTVLVLAVSSDGSNLYAGGSFVSAGGANRNRLAAVDISSNTLLSWDPNADGAVYTITPSYDKTTFFAGGTFTSMGGLPRSKIAQIGVLAGAPNSWNPGADGTVRTIQASSDGKTVYAGGLFSNIGGTAKKYLAALDPTTGIVVSTWNPYPDNNVYSIRISPDNKTLYAGGDFKNIGMQSQNYIAALNTGTGGAGTWPSTADASVSSLELSSDGSILYAGGSFTTMCGQKRNKIAAITPSDGTILTWNPGANGTVHALKLSASGQALYAGGTFTSIGKVTRKYAASLNTSNSNATSWNPNPDSTIFAFAVSGDQTTLLAGGTFTTVAGQKCQYLAGFKSGYYHLTVENGTGDGNYASGTLVTITANIPPTGYYFDKWTGNTSSLADPSSPSTKATILSSDIAVKANYKAFPLTITFTAGPNGSIKGTTTQTINYGSSTKSVTAVPTNDYKLDNWTSPEGFSSVVNPLVIKSVSMNMAITANFAPAAEAASLTVSSSPAAGGTTTPSGASTVILNRPLTVTATPAAGYHFVSWSGSGSASIFDPFSSSTTLTISAEAAVSANFAVTPAEASLTVAVSPVGAGEATPSGTNTFKTAEPITITATPNTGFYFLGWTYSSGAVTVANCLSPTTTATLYDNATITANFAAIQQETNLTLGKIYTLDAKDVPIQGFANFAKSPQAYGQYTDPVSAKIKKASLKNLTKIKTQVEMVDLEWTAKFPLLNTKVWTQSKYDTTMQILAANPPSSVTCRLFVKAVDSNGLMTDKYAETAIDLYEVQPEIQGVYNQNGQRISAASAGQKIIIEGAFFGKNVPALWIEYKDKNGIVKKQNLKVDKNLLRFPDYSGKAAKYPMDIYTGESELTAYMPSKWSKSWTHIGNHNIVIDNKICRTTIQFWTLP